MAVTENQGAGGAAAAADGGVRRARLGLALLGVLLIAVNLRVGFVSVGPLLGSISTDLQLTSSQAGLLTGLPLIAFALFSPLAPPLARGVGLDRALWLSLLLLAAGIVGRSLPVPGAIWAGTAVIGIAIAFLNVLLPSLGKRDFPERVSQVTGIYSSAQSAAAAVGTALVVPIAGTTPDGWRLALGVWAGVALLALAALLPRVLRREPPAPTAAVEGAGRSPWRSLLGWQVTAFMGLQSISFYVFMAWLPSIEHSFGISEAEAGLHTAVFLLVGMAASLVAGALLHRFADQRAVAVGSSVLAAVAFAGLAAFPQVVLVWVVCGAAAGGALIVTALSLFSLRTSSPAQAASLSGMAQSLGYGLAALGPIGFGALYDATGSWTPSLVATAAVMAVLCVLALLVGRNRVIG